MDADVERWWRRRHFDGSAFIAGELSRQPRPSVAVVLPALDEVATIGEIVTSLRNDLGERGAALVDELVVVDSGSSDGTARRAAEAGARVVQPADVLTDMRPMPGKGEALWRGVAATHSDIVVFLDSDVTDFSTDFVTGLLGPLLTTPEITLVKATYDRPLTLSGPAAETVMAAGGGRVTELVARPLLALFYPELAGFVQPLAGEYAARRSLLETLAFPTGYGVEVAILIDSLRSVGLDALAQVDLRRRSHSHNTQDALGRMATEVMLTVMSRVDAESRVTMSEPLGTQITQFSRVAGCYQPTTHDMLRPERPPLRDVAAYVTAR